MPFDSDPKEPRETKVKLNKVSSQKSMFDGQPKKPTPQEFQQQVQLSQDRASSYKRRASDLALQFNRLMADKTLSENKNVFAHEAEKELLQNMIQLAIEINNDANEQEGMGSLSWITVLFKTCLSQRDRINHLEYNMFKMEKKLDSTALTEFITKEINKVLDKKKISE